MNSIGNNKVLLFIGKRNTGKSVLVLDYLYYNQDMPFCTCISPTDDFNLTFRPHVPSRFIFDTYTPETIKNFLTRQKVYSKKKKMAESGHGDPRMKNIDPRGVLIMDDCLADSKEWVKDSSIRWIFMNGRHANITLILTMQYQVGIPPGLRVNIDYCFICKETKRTEKEKLWKYYAGMFPTLDMFVQILDQATANYGCLVIDNTSQSDKLIDQVFHYRAKLREPGSFRICYDDFWVNNEDYINDDDDIPDNLYGKNNQQNNYQQFMSGRNKYRFKLGIDDNNGWRG